MHFSNMKTNYPAAVMLTYSAIMRSNVFTRNGPSINLPRALRLLGEALDKHELPEYIWDNLGEFSGACLGDLVVAAYWACSEWHDGQFSDTYAAYCSPGKVFSPGATCSPKPDDSEFIAYELMGKWFNTH